MSKATTADFGPDEPLLCATCGEREATHEIGIRVQRGFDYQHAKQLFHVTYSVCGDCARDVVTVKLDGKLASARKR